MMGINPDEYALQAVKKDKPNHDFALY